MNRIRAMIAKELKMYFNTPLGYIFITAFLVVSAWIFMQGFFLRGEATMREYFNLLPWLFLFIIPAITMRTWAEEKKQGTIEVLFTLPIKDYEIVIGKFLASLLFVIAILALTLPLAIVVIYAGGNDFGVLFGSYLGAIFLASAYISIGLFVSSLTSNQIVAFIGATIITFIFMIIGSEFFLAALPKSLATITKYLDLSIHFQNIARGVIDSRDIIYYLSMVTIFLGLNTYSISRNK